MNYTHLRSLIEEKKDIYDASKGDLVLQLSNDQTDILRIGLFIEHGVQNKMFRVFWQPNLFWKYSKGENGYYSTEFSSRECFIVLS